MADIRVKDNPAIAAISGGDILFIDDISEGAAGVDSRCTAAELKAYVLGTGVDIGGTGAGDIVTIDGVQTMTGKRLTSPKFNEDVAMSATSTELDKLHGCTATTANLNLTNTYATEIAYLAGLTATVASSLATIPAVTARTWTYGEGWTTTGTSKTFTAAAMLTALSLSSASYIIDPTTVSFQLWDVTSEYTINKLGTVDAKFSLTTSGGQTYMDTLTLTSLTHGPNNYAISISFKIVEKAGA